MQLCTCAEVPLPPHISELADCYGVSNPGAPNSLFPHNAVSIRVQARACGRLHCSSHASVLPPGEHAAGEAALCAALSGAVSAALAPYFVGRGDEGDHRWQPFALPAMPPPPAPEVPPPRGLVSGEELLSAACGALWPELAFAPPRPAAEVAAELDAREGEEATNEGAAWRAAAAALEAAGARGAAYLRPVERGGGFGPSVWPHFLLARTPTGSLVGAVGATVWT